MLLRILSVHEQGSDKATRENLLVNYNVTVHCPLIQKEDNKLRPEQTMNMTFATEKN